MKNYSTIFYQLMSVIGKDEIKTEDIVNSLSKASSFSQDSLINLRTILLDFTNKSVEAINIVKRQFEEHKQPEQTIFDATYFYKEVLGKNKATFSLWKRNGFFKNELGTERNQKVTIEEIEKFLEDPRYKKYRKFWEKRK